VQESAVAAAAAINVIFNYQDTPMKSVPTKKSNVIGAALFAAALALPSAHPAFAEAAPEKGIVAFKYLNYEDSNKNPDQDRIGVDASTVSVMVPIVGKWSVSSSFTYDSVSGASPKHHTYITPDMLSGASKIHEIRRAGDLSVTRYLPKGSVTIGSSYSSESDYISRSYSAQGSMSTEDKNTTFTLGGSYTSDSINSNNGVAVNQKKDSVAGLIGITKVMTKQDVLQLDLGYSNSYGYMSDPYKESDIRPGDRNSKTVLTRWNHHFDGTDGTSRLSYRFYTDSYGINAHTFGVEYVQPMSNEWTVTPSLRYYSQTTANFYIPVDPLDPEVAPFPTGTYSTYDQRLAGFGALTAGIKVSKRIAKDWLVDAKFEQYEQRVGWSLTGHGDNGLAPFSARFIQLGVSRLL
jgi:hypothetical protein